MKKFIAVAAILSVMFFGIGTSQALIGVPDDVPGTDILVPFFYVSMPGFGTENTLMTITEMKRVVLNPPVNPVNSTNVAGWVQTIDSETVHNFGFWLTRRDVWSNDALSIINTMSPLAQAALEIDTDNDGVNDHWAGYIYFFNNTWLFNNLISNCYQVYLAAGMAASFNGVSLEFDFQGDPVRQGNAGTAWQGIFGDEVFSANALWSGKNLLAGLGVPLVDATFMRLLPRYFVLDDVAESILMIWTERFFSWNWNVLIPGNGPIPLPGSIHVNFYDEDENQLSANIPIDHELNVIRVRDILPGGLFAGYPWGGWIDIVTPDLFGQAWFTDANVNGIWDGAERQWLVYSWQRAIGPAAEAWEVMHPAHRECDHFIGPNP